MGRVDHGTVSLKIGALGLLGLVGCGVGLIDGEEDIDVVEAEVPPRSCATISPEEMGTTKAVVEPPLLDARGGTIPAPTSTVVVPVHVHVVTRLDGQGSVDDAMVAGQIKVLDDAFGAAGFDFKLVSVDRVKRDAWFAMTPGSLAERSVKRAMRLGGPGALNLYTAGPSDGELGWASFPSGYAGDPAADGVVVYHGSLPGGRGEPYNEGDTATHEVGHWLGLQHTFEGGCDKANDLVADTAAQAEPGYGCPFGRDTCTGATFPGRDPVENFMGLSDDACMVAFTPGQAARMQAHWAAYRTAR